jgi:tRNA threonylcarbamoyladenosine biosynthesis protein TsaE
MLLTKGVLVYTKDMAVKNIEIVTKSEAETVDFAASFSALLKGGDAVFLWGDLGAGKSVFCRSIIRTLSGDPALEVPSPTYTLVQMYTLQGNVLWHFDLYRLSTPDEIYEIGWEEALSGGIMLVEWPERLGGLLPARRIDVRLENIPQQPNQRKVSIVRHGL